MGVLVFHKAATTPPPEHNSISAFPKEACLGVGANGVPASIH